MADITELLKNIMSKVYGKDVRQSIHDAIKQCYLDGKVGAIDMVARSRIDNIVAENNNTSGNSELTDIRVGANGKTYTSAGEAVREQIEEANNLLEELNAHMESARELLTVNYIDTRFFMHGSFDVSTGSLEESSTELTSIPCYDFKGRSIDATLNGIKGYQIKTFHGWKSGRIETDGNWGENGVAWTEGSAYDYIIVSIRREDGADITKDEIDGLIYTTLPELRKFCDIRAHIANGSHGSTDVNLQSKTVTPNFDQQTIRPDQGYDGFSSVTVKSIPYEETTSGEATTVKIG